jgi:hypothetical protein
VVLELNKPNVDKKPVGMHVIPATGRQFYWTGKVAIGLMHQAPKLGPSEGEVIIQRLLLDR